MNESKSYERESMKRKVWRKCVKENTFVKCELLYTLRRHQWRHHNRHWWNPLLWLQLQPACYVRKEREKGEGWNIHSLLCWRSTLFWQISWHLLKKSFYWGKKLWCCWKKWCVRITLGVIWSDEGGCLICMPLAILSECDGFYAHSLPLPISADRWGKRYCAREIMDDVEILDYSERNEFLHPTSARVNTRKHTTQAHAWTRVNMHFLGIERNNHPQSPLLSRSNLTRYACASTRTHLLPCIAIITF